MSDNVVELHKTPVVYERGELDPNKVDPTQFVAACSGCDSSAFKLYADGLVICYDCGEEHFLRCFDPDSK